MSSAILEFDELFVAYEGVPAIEGVSLHVVAGTIVTVIGPNGAGKTTLLNAAMGVLPSRGGLRLHGRPIGHLPVEDRVREGLSLVPERRELFGTLTVEDNLRLGAWRRRRLGPQAARAALDEAYALFPRLRERRAQPAGTLSGGERQMLAIGRALMARPSVLMLDEPSLGLAPLIVRDIFHAITELRTTGVAILLVEQNARAALQVSERGYVLEGGRIVLEGMSSTLAADPRVTDTYLGGG